MKKILSAISNPEDIPFFNLLLESEKAKSGNELIGIAKHVVKEYSLTDEGAAAYITFEGFDWYTLLYCTDKPVFKEIATKNGIIIDNFSHIDTGSYDVITINYKEPLMDDVTAKVKVIWDADGHEDELPRTVTLAGFNPSQDIADRLSDEYGFCVRSYSVSFLDTESTVNSISGLVEKVVDRYTDYDNDTELNSLFFDFPVSMKKKDILQAYGEIQSKINGDIVEQAKDGQNIPYYETCFADEPEFQEIYTGNCKEFLESFNDRDQFRRYDEDDDGVRWKLSFIL